MTRRVLAGVLALAAGSAQAEICYSDTYDTAAPVLVTASTVFDCPTLGRKSLTAIAAAGYGVVRLTPVVASRDGPTTRMAQQLIVELREEIFAHGFE